MALIGEIKRRDAFRLLQVLRLQRDAPSLVSPDRSWSPTMGLLLAEAFPFGCAVAMWEARQAVALAQMACQSGRDQWEIMHLAVADTRRAPPEDPQVFRVRARELLDEVCRLAGTKRMTGVVARVSAEPWLTASFRAAGFTVTTQEDLFVRPVPAAASAPRIVGLRPQQRDDAWPLQRLYLRSVPPDVRFAEGRSARDWQLRRRLSRLPSRTTRWVVAEQGDIRGWLTETPAQGEGLRVQVGVAPGQRQLAQDLVATAIAQGAERGFDRVWSRAPAYATDVQQALVASGFTKVGTELVLKRSLAVRVRNLAPSAVTAQSEAGNGLPATQSRLSSRRIGERVVARAARG